MPQRRHLAVVFLSLSFLALADCRAAANRPAWHRFTSNGAEIAYTDEGSGEPVVLVHGLGSSADMNWRRPGTIGLLSPHFRVIAFDLRDHGRSSRTSSCGVAMAEDLGNLLDHLHLSSVHVVGYSLGGIVALKFTAMHPERVRSLLLGGMGCLLEGSSLQDLWSHLGQRRGSGVSQACIRGIADLAVTPEQIKRIRVPAEVLIGERDPVNRLYVAPLQRIRSDWPVVRIAGAGHLNCVVKPDFQNGIKQWLTAQQRKAPGM